MSVRINVGDPIFSKRGDPGVVVNKNESTQSIQVESRSELVEDTFRHGYIKGLDPQMRQQFNKIMDDITEIGDAKTKMLALQKTIESMEKDEEVFLETRSLVNYLKSELFHIMQLNNISPQEYEVPYYELSK